MEKTNFYDSIYSPIILTTSALLIALMCILSVSGTDFTALFGMTAGTAAALIAYVDKVFSPLQSMGMEIENIQSAMAGAHRIREFLGEKEMETTETSPRETGPFPFPFPTCPLPMMGTIPCSMISPSPPRPVKNHHCRPHRQRQDHPLQAHLRPL